jgi:hypothetical protein
MASRSTSKPARVLSTVRSTRVSAGSFRGVDTRPGTEGQHPLGRCTRGTRPAAVAPDGLAVTGAVRSTRRRRRFFSACLLVAGPHGNPACTSSSRGCPAGSSEHRAKGCRPGAARSTARMASCLRPGVGHSQQDLRCRERRRGRVEASRGAPCPTRVGRALRRMAGLILRSYDEVADHAACPPSARAGRAPQEQNYTEEMCPWAPSRERQRRLEGRPLPALTDQREPPACSFRVRHDRRRLVAAVVRIGGHIHPSTAAARTRRGASCRALPKRRCGPGGLRDSGVRLRCPCGQRARLAGTRGHVKEPRRHGVLRL